MTSIIDAYRAVLIRGERPDLLSLAVVAMAGGVLLGLAHLLFRRASVNFAEQF